MDYPASSSMINCFLEKRKETEEREIEHEQEQREQHFIQYEQRRRHHRPQHERRDRKLVANVKGQQPQPDQDDDAHGRHQQREEAPQGLSQQAAGRRVERRGELADRFGQAEWQVQVLARVHPRDQ